MDRHSIAHFHTAADIVARRRAADPSPICSAGAGENPMWRGQNRLIDDLKLRRHILGWSVNDVAERCGIDVASLSQWEHGGVVPRLDATQRWAAALGLHFALVPAEKAVRPGLRVDWQARRIAVDGTPVRLTPMEWKALERLARAPGELVSHQALFHHLYGEECAYRAQSTAIRVLITKLRRLLPLRIEAQWGKGYVLSGVASSLHDATEDGEGVGEGTVAPEPAVAAAPCDRLVSAPPAAAPASVPGPAGGRMVAIDEPKRPRAASPQSRPAACRAEELGVIEQFLAERGVTRCPDVATIERSPLPTLVWDKVKRKWVRPSAAGCVAV